MARKYTRDWYLERRNPAPKNEIAQWAVKYAIPNFFLYQVKDKRKQGQCTACKSEYSLNVNKNRYTVCPKCNLRIKAVEKTKEWRHEYDCFVSYLEKYDEYFLHRIFRVARRFRANQEEIQIQEAQMQVLALPMKTNRWGCKYFSRETSYCNSNYFTRHGIIDGRTSDLPEYWERGVLGGYGYNIYQAVKYVYPKNLQCVLNGTSFEYSTLWELAGAAVPFNIYKALLTYERRPQLEYLIKLKMYNLACGLIEHRLSVNGEETNIKKFLGLNTQEQLDYVIKNNLNSSELDLYQARIKHNLPDTKAVKQLCSISRWYGQGLLDDVLSIMTADNFYAYYQEQTKAKKIRFKDFCIDYKDHLRILKQLGADIHNTMYSKPKDFYALHSRLSAELKAQEKQVFDAQITAVYDAIHKLCEWSDEKYSVIMPSTAKAIVQEGIDQAHCVGNYTERVARNESVILFVRRKETIDKSWYTMEIKPDMKRLHIVQCRGYENRDLSPKDAKDIEFVKEKYAAWFNRRSTDGYAGEIITKYYKAVRKIDGKYISNYDRKTEYKIGEEIAVKADENPDYTAVPGVHVASLSFAQHWGEAWRDVAILELEVDIHDVIVPNALDQVRASKARVVREVPFAEMGAWGALREKILQAS